MTRRSPRTDSGARHRLSTRTAAARTTIGRIMVGVAVVGLVVSLVGTIVAWQLVGRLNESTRSTLDVTIDTIDSVEASIDVADQVLGATTETIDTAATTLETVADSFEAGTGVVDEVGDLTAVVGPALEAAGTSLRQLEGIGTGIDDVLGQLSSIPFGPDYDPDKSLGDTIGDLATEIEALPAEFDDTSTNIDEFATTLDDLETNVSDLALDVAAVSERLAGSDVLIAQYRTNIGDARAVAVETRDGLDGDVGLMRLILLVGGINLAIGQIVPYWIGRSLLDEGIAD